MTLQRRSLTWPVAIAAVGLVSSAIGYWIIDASARRQLATEFTALAQRDADQIANKFEGVAGRLRALEQLYASSKEVDSDEFTVFTSGLDPLDGLEAYEWIPRVPHSERGAFEVAATEAGVSGFAIREKVDGVLVSASARAEYFPVRFVWPMKGNAAAVGFDLASNQARREVLERARDTGLICLSDPITLVQETGTAVGQLALLAHYRNGAPHNTLEERRENLQGYSLVVLRPGTLLESALSRSNGAPVGLHLSLVIRRPNSDPLMVYDHRSRAVGGGFALAGIPGGLEYRSQLKGIAAEGGAGGQGGILEVVVTPSPAFASLHARDNLALVLAGVVVVNALLIAVVVLVVRQGRLLDEQARLELGVEQERTTAAQRASAAKSEFLATMSHEIRTPMNGVIGMLDVLMQSSLRASQMDMARTIRVSAFSLLDIINEILDFSKIEAGKLELTHQAMSLERVIAGACTMLESVATKQRVEMTSVVDPKLPQSSMGDPLRLQQVLVNLIGNAIKFSSGLDRLGRVTVRAVATGEFPDHGWIEIVVADNGIGMDEALQGQLFQPFVQGEGRTTRKYGGTGLGLTISKRIVELMGGDIRVESARHVGSTFTVRIPCTLGPEGHGAELSVHTTSDPPVPTRSRVEPLAPAGVILVAEDNEINQEVIRRQMQLLGYSIEIVEDGAQALERWRRGSYALLVTDLHMPEIDGYEVAATIRREEASGRARIPIIALTANALKGEAANCKALGMDDYISKPVLLADLKAVLDRWMPTQSASVSPSDAIGTPPIDEGVLAAQIGADAALMAQFLSHFQIRCRAGVAEVAAAVAEGQTQTAGALAHKLKGSARSVGATALATHCQAIELAGKGGNAAEMAEAIPFLLKEAAVIERYFAVRLSPRA